MKNTLKKLYLLLILAGSFASTFAQQGQWFIKNLSETNSHVLDFRDPGSVSVDVNPLDITDHPYGLNVYDDKEAHNAIYDENGDLALFITHDAAYTADGTLQNFLISHSGSNFQDYTSDEELFDHDLAIVKVPEHCDRYYIIRFAYDGPALKRNLLHYYIYDLGLNAFIDEGTDTAYSPGDWVYGEFLFAAFNPIAHHNKTRGLSVSTRNNDGNRYLFFEHSASGLEINKAKITSSGIFYEGPIYTGSLGATSTHETEVIQTPAGNYLYATCKYDAFAPSYGSHGMILTLDAEGNLLSEDQFAVDGKIKGMEFSPDASLLYFTHTKAPHLQYVEISNPTLVLDLAPTFGTVGEYFFFNAHKDDYPLSSIEVANNGKMYYAGTSGISSLASPNDPNSLWVNNEIAVLVDEVTRGILYNEIYRLIPLPVQVDGEKDYTPITWPSNYSSCDGTFEEICVEDYPGFDYRWSKVGSDLVLGTGPCFTPTSAGNYTIRITDENGCVRTHTFTLLMHTVWVPGIDDSNFCMVLPVNVGWPAGTNFADSPCFESIEWYYEGAYEPLFDDMYRISFQGFGTYCAKVTIGGITTTRCFEVVHCCDPELDFSIFWHMGDVPYTITINNYPDNIEDYDQESFLLYVDCNNDGLPGPWTLIESIMRTDPTEFDDEINFEGLDENCFYKVVHRVSSFCKMQSYTYTQYVGGAPGIAGTPQNSLRKMDFSSKGKPSVYPSPSTGYFTLDLTETYKNTIVEVRDILGKMVYAQKVEDSISLDIDLSTADKGVYFVNVWSGDHWISQRVILTD